MSKKDKGKKHKPGKHDAGKGAASDDLLHWQPLGRLG